MNKRIIETRISIESQKGSFLKICLGLLLMTIYGAIVILLFGLVTWLFE